jgi:pyruvate formate lyase activating enzyme
MDDQERTGYIHSYTTASAYDGPGLRTVLWTTGCNLRCQYCHNPDTWRLRGGRSAQVGEVVAELARYEPFMRATGGGVTISGGEPLLQTPFVMGVLRGCKARGLHTALDTSGFLGERLADDDLRAIDLVILDIKSWDAATHKALTGVEVGPVLHFARRLAALGRPAWVRFVLVPGLTDAPDNVAGLAEFVASLGNVERVEVLPFHQLGRAKWAELGLAYPLQATPPPSHAALAQAVAAFAAQGLPTVS